MIKPEPVVANQVVDAVFAVFNQLSGELRSDQQAERIIVLQQLIGFVLRELHGDSILGRAAAVGCHSNKGVKIYF